MLLLDDLCWQHIPSMKSQGTECSMVVQVLIMPPWIFSVSYQQRNLQSSVNPEEVTVLILQQQLYLGFKSRQMSLSFSSLQWRGIMCVVSLYWMWKISPWFQYDALWMRIELSTTAERVWGKMSLFKHKIPARMSRNAKQNTAEVEVLCLFLRCNLGMLLL